MKLQTSTWDGRRGRVTLGPTETRVAVVLDDLTRHGRITLRTTELARRCRIHVHEAYRITRRLRVLGLFGVENDQGGRLGGRRYWRTRIAHDGAQLDAARHREAVRRLIGWARYRRDQLTAAIDHLRVRDGQRASSGRPVFPPSAGPSFAESMRAAGLGQLMDAWGVT